MEVGADKIVECSTLTGACMISLGDEVAGVWTSSDELAEALAASADRSGDPVWRMPLVKAYNDSLKSKVADLKNIAGRYGGAITAALFLQNFVRDTEKTPFAHVDLAGPVWDNKGGEATGFGARLLTQWVQGEAKN